MISPSHSPSVFAITRMKVFVVVSLSITWWFASILPHYRPTIQANLSARLDEALQNLPSIKVDWDTGGSNPRDAYNASKVALLIEHRPLPHLVPQILHMISVVPPDWRFLFIGSNKSVLSVGRAYATKHQQVIGKLDLMVLPEPWEIDQKEKVFRLLTDQRFYDEFLPGVEWLLKYESDSIMCANSDTSLNDWLHWSWVGAPRTLDDRFSGNGGLSLRRVSTIRRILGFQKRYNDTEAEDEWFGKRVYILPGAKVASGSDEAFAVEDVYIDNAMGYHVRNGGKDLADTVWQEQERRHKIFDYCPELSMIMDMKLEQERCPGDNRQGAIIPTAQDEDARRQRIAEAARLAGETEAIRMAQEAEAWRKAEESEARRKAEEAEAKRKAEEAEAEKAAVTEPGPESEGEWEAAQNEAVDQVRNSTLAKVRNSTADGLLHKPYSPPIANPQSAKTPIGIPAAYVGTDRPGPDV